MHRVMFGEYIPFAEWLPFLYRITPLTGGIVAGKAPAALVLDEIHCFVPNICYETAIPHVIRRQVAELESKGNVPDALVNMTNDAWYWGSNELDMHLACGVFRAVETRLTLVIAANGGISAWIDSFGRVKAQSPRLRPDISIADIETSTLRSAYVRYGDWFAGLCLLCGLVLAMIGWRTRLASSAAAPDSGPQSSG
jgi:apolipoprotein N-acyltransferase